MSIYLCGNTGIINRGCEAIVRSTNKLLSSNYSSIYLATQAPQQDNLMCKEIGVSLLKYNSLNIVQKVFAKAMHIIGNYTYLERIRQDGIISKLSSKDICLNIGGDTYCYGKPLSFMALNKFAKAKGARTILWCCSVEDSVIKGDVKTDLNRYNYIFARDPITVENLLKNGIKAEKIVKVCDPAFFLDKAKIELPNVFEKGDVVGINVSECVIKGDDDTVYNAVLNFARYILQNTDFNICLIPHVYNIEKGICDWPILKSLEKDLASDRVGLVDKELNCEQLKYIISNCRFMVAARTHASIAAYSTCVPTMVLGYSVKSKGIATDLFGTYDNYVVPYDEIQTEKDLIKPFEFLIENEDTIQQGLKTFIPIYKKTLTDAIEKYLQENIDFSQVCDRFLCSGCLACYNICHQNAINLKTDFKGFTYPEIDLHKCIRCNKCRMVCPSLNKVKDSLVEPRCFGVINPNETERKDSSSGGAFIKIASSFMSSSGIVYGVAFDENYDAKFLKATSLHDLKKLQKSKYVQAQVDDIYIQVKSDLDSGKRVLFTGCPCHVVALKRVLGKDYENLTTIDIICHGVPSPNAWKEYKDYVCKKHASSISGVSFREKDEGWINFSVLLLLLNGEKEVNLLNQDKYFRGFIQHYYLRESCYNCSTRNMHRVSDITLADFWGIDKLDPTMFDDKGTSLLLVHSQKGHELIEILKKEAMCKEYHFDESITYNPAYLLSGTPNVFSNHFDEEWRKNGLMIALDKYLNLPKHKIAYAIKSIKTWSD